MPFTSGLNKENQRKELNSLIECIILHQRQKYLYRNFMTKQNANNPNAFSTNNWVQQLNKPFTLFLCFFILILQFLKKETGAQYLLKSLAHIESQPNLSTSKSIQQLEMTQEKKGDRVLLGRTVFHYSVNLMNVPHTTEVFQIQLFIQQIFIQCLLNVRHSGHKSEQQRYTPSPPGAFNLIGDKHQ